MLHGSSRNAGSTRFAVIVVVVVLLVWGAVGLLLWHLVGGGIGLTGEAYARVEVAPGKTLWVEVKGNRARAAETKEALQTAQWAEAEEGEGSKSPAALVDLPLGGEKLDGWDKVEVSFERVAGATDITWRLGRKDSEGALWTYMVSEEGAAHLSRDPERIPTFTIPSLEACQLEVQGVAKSEEGGPAVGVALALSSGRYQIPDVQKDGESVEAEARVLDGEGNVVGETTATLDDLGFT